MGVLLTASLLWLGGNLTLSAQIWLGSGGNDFWTTAANWTAPPANDGTASLTFGATTRLSSDVDTPFAVLGITFANTAGPYVITGDPLTIGSGGIENHDLDLQQFDNAITLAASQTWDAEAGNLQFNGAVAFGANPLTLSGPRTVTFDAARSGSGNLLLADNVSVIFQADSTRTGNTTISESNSGATLSFSSATQIASGDVTINQNGRLRLLDQGGATITLGQNFSWNGGRFSNSSSPVIDIEGATDTLELTSAIALTNRAGIVKEGPGTLVYAPASLATNSRWSLAIDEGLVEMNQLPYQIGANPGGRATGDLEFIGDSVLRVIYDPAIAAALPSLSSNNGRYGYGFANVRVADGVEAAIEVESGAVFKTTGRIDSNHRFLGENSKLILDGEDLTSIFQFGYSNSGGDIDETPANRTIELRGGTLSFFGSGANKPFWPQTADFTFELNGGEYDGRQEAGLQSLAGNLEINNDPTSSDPRVRAWIVSDTGGANASYGNLLWRGNVDKVGSPGDTWSFDRNTSGSGTGGYVAIDPGASLTIEGGIVSVAGGLDVFTDSFDPSRHLNLTIDAGTTLNANRDIGIGTLDGEGAITTSTAGSKTILLESADSGSFGGVISDGSGQLAVTKKGGGTQIFTEAQTYTGATLGNGGTLTLAGDGTLLNTSSITIQLGSLVLDNTSLNNGNRLGNGIGITLGTSVGASSLQFLGSASATSTETVGTITIAEGTASIFIDPGMGQSATLTLSGLTQISGSTLAFEAGSGILGGGGLTDPSIFITGQADGLIGGWATVGNAFAHYDASGGLGVQAYTATQFNYDSNTGTLRDIDVNLTQTLTNNDAELTVRYVAPVDTDFGGFNVNIHNGGLFKADATTTTVSNGTLTAGNTSASDLTITVVEGGQLNIDAVIEDNSSAAVTLVKSGGGTLTLGADNTITGGIYFNEGVVQIDADEQLGANTNDLFFAGGTLRVEGSTGVTLNAGRTISIQDGLNGTFEVNNNAVRIASTDQLQGDATTTLIKEGDSILRVTEQQSNFEGDVVVAEGTFELRGNGRLGTLGNRGAIILEGGQLTTRVNGDTDFEHDIIVTADSTLDAGRENGAGPLTATHEFGALTIGNSTLLLQSPQDYEISFEALSLTGTAELEVSDNTAIDGPVTGAFGFTKSGSGTLTLEGDQHHTYSGALTVTDGTLLLDKTGGATAVTGDLHIQNGSTVQLLAGNQIADGAAVVITDASDLDLNGFNETIGSLSSGSSASQVHLGSGTLTTGLDGTNTTFAGAISGTGGVTKVGGGTLTLSGANTYSGSTLVNEGTIALGANDVLSDNTVVNIALDAMFAMQNFDDTIAGLNGSGAVQLGSGTLTLETTGTTTFEGVISGSGGLIVEGTGIQELAGANTFSGPLEINGGTLLLGDSDVLADSVDVTLDGGTFDTGGQSDNLNTLTLSSNSSIDLGNASSILRFSDSSTNGWTAGSLLSLLNWNGLEEGGGTDQIYIGTNAMGVTATQLGQIQFIDPFGPGSGIYAAKILSSGEIVPVPEACTALAAFLLAGWGTTRRRYSRRAPLIVNANQG